MNEAFHPLHWSLNVIIMSGQSLILTNPRWYKGTQLANLYTYCYCVIDLHCRYISDVWNEGFQVLTNFKREREREFKEYRSPCHQQICDATSSLQIRHLNLFNAISIIYPHFICILDNHSQTVKREFFICGGRFSIEY